MSVFRGIAIFALLLFALAGCATLGKTDMHTTNSGAKIEYLLVENNASADTVVFENGLDGKVEHCAKVLPEISKSATVFAYNRPSYGNSDAVTTPRDGEHIVDELKSMLVQKGLKPPYILVGHSLGGLYMQYFMRRYPDEVKALVLVDSTHPMQFTGDASMDKWPWWVRFGFVEIMLNSSQAEELRLATKTGEAVLALPPPQKRVTILSAQKPLAEKSPMADHANKLRREMTNLYPHSKQIWVDSGHGIPLEKPEAVITAIMEIIDQK